MKPFATHANGSSAAVTDFPFCMVISRPCVVAHKGQVVVAGVKAYSDGLPGGIDSLDKVLDFMTGVRDGVEAPDVFYLGQLPGQTGRFCSRLDSIHTIELPTKPDLRQPFVDRHRIAALNQDFQRALHARIFASFASLGFDDHKWPSDTDLEWIVTQGTADIKKKDGEVAQFRAAKTAADAAGKDFKQSKELAKAEKELGMLRDRMAPYEAELTARTHRLTHPSGAGDRMADRVAGGISIHATGTEPVTAGTEPVPPGAQSP